MLTGTNCPGWKRVRCIQLREPSTRVSNAYLTDVHSCRRLTPLPLALAHIYIDHLPSFPFSPCTFLPALLVDIPPVALSSLLPSPGQRARCSITYLDT